MSKTVLIIDDSVLSRTMINDALKKVGFDVVGLAIDGQRGIDMAITHEPDIITLDNILPDMLGSDVMKVIKEENLNAKVIVISAVGHDSHKTKMLELGADHYLVKPFTNKALLDVVYSLV